VKAESLHFEVNFALVSDERVTVDSFVLLDSDDLKDLGFPLGPRKLLCKYTATKRCTTDASATNNGPSTSTSDTSMSEIANNCTSVSNCWTV